MRELFESLRATERKQENLDNQVQEILEQIVASEGNGPFSFEGRTFIIAKSGGRWAVRAYNAPTPKVIE